jgi:integrase
MAVNVLSRALKDAVKEKRIPSNPVRDATKPRVGKHVFQPLDPEQLARFLQTAKPDRLYPLYVMAIDTGMREGELFALAWEDIDFKTGSVMVRRALKELKGRLWLDDLKTEKSRRRITMSSTSLAELHEHRKRMLAEGHAAAPVFCDTEGNHLRRPNVARRSFFKILKKAGLPQMRFHDLRHTCATMLALANVPTKVTSERLGHGSTQVTENIYAHVLPTMQKQAADTMTTILTHATQPPLAAAVGSP